MLFFRIRPSVKPVAVLALAMVLTSCASQTVNAPNPNALDLTSTYYGLRFLDLDTRRGIPLVEVQTTNGLRYVSDSAGWIAINPRDISSESVFYTVKSDGYSMPAVDPELQGFRALVRGGEGRQIGLKRHNIAERLYRLTGEGIYHDSQLLGQPTPINTVQGAAGGVFGQDSVMNALYEGKLYWFWGDTLRGDHPLGNFSVSGAVTEPPGSADLEPDKGIQLEYFVGEDGFTRPMCPLEGPGPVWINCLLAFQENGRDHMFALYTRTSPNMTRLEAGIARWSNENALFEKQIEIPVDAPMIAYAHPIPWQSGDQAWLLYGYVMPYVRVRAREADITNPESYEIYSCLQEGHTWSHNAPALDRDENGALDCDWKKNTSPIEPNEWEQMIQSGKVKASEYRGRLVSAETDEVIIPHRGTVSWNNYRNRWVMISVQVNGSSYLGEVWYAESLSPFGPWTNVKRVVTHDDYTFYNVKQHPYFAKGRHIYFEGTYTKTYSGRNQPTPRYDYNQIMYRLDLSDPRLGSPPTPKASSADGNSAES